MIEVLVESEADVNAVDGADGLLLAAAHTDAVMITN